MDKRLFLLDAFALIFRAHFAFIKNPRINSKGVNTSVPFGFTNTLVDLLKNQQPSHIAVCFDTPAQTFRDELYAEYKAHRQETPEDIIVGTPIVKDIIRAFQIPVIAMDGFEADDVIGTLAHQAAERGYEVFMMTPDKDYGQLVRKNVWLYKPSYLGSGVEQWGEKEVCAKWDITQVSQVIDILGLQGDASDNIPGVPGVGPKTAADLLKRYGTVENVIAHAHELKGKLKERIEQHQEQALLSKKLATIDTNVPVQFNEEDFLYKGIDEAKLRPLFEELEFRTLGNRLFTSTSSASSATQQPTQTQLRESKDEQLQIFSSTKSVAPAGESMYKDVVTDEDVEAVIQKLTSQNYFSWEMLTDHAEHFDFKIKGIALSLEPHSAYVFRQEAHWKKLFPFFENPTYLKIGFQPKLSLQALYRLGVKPIGKWFDVHVAHYLIEPESSHELDVLSQVYVAQTYLGSQDEVQYYGERTDLSLRLYAVFKDELQKRGHYRLMTDVEMPLMEVLAEMEYEGVTIDTNELAAMSTELQVESKTEQTKIFELAGKEFNINSPKQLGDILFDDMKLMDKAKKTKSGQYSTGEEVLAKLADAHPIISHILTYREIEKLRSTYVDALPKMVSQTDGRVHTDYRQAVAVTGRLSSFNPNLQNIPIRTERGRKIRKAFIASSPDKVLLSADYSQIELRLAACFAHDTTMIEAFKNKKDIHAITASRVFKVPLQDVTPDMRRKAKEVNFGILYGSTAFGLSQNIGISKTEAASIIEAYFTEFSAIKKYMDDSINFAREHGYVETLLGRKRYLKDIYSQNVSTRGFAERNAINAPIQGSAADVIKLAMIQIQQWLKNEKLNTKMIMQVHDELIFDVPKEELTIVQPKIHELMQSVVHLDVVLEVESGYAGNWLGAH